MNWPKQKVLVIDDEPSVQLELVKALNESTEFEVIGTAETVEDAYLKIIQKKPDAIFLDIKLIGGDAYQLLQTLQRKKQLIPPTIINTGYREFELIGEKLNQFRQDVVWVLKKPFWHNWKDREQSIIAAIEAHQDARRIETKINQPISDALKIKSDNKIRIIRPQDIGYIRTGEKGQGKTEIICSDTIFSIQKSLRQTLEKLPHYFLQVSRFYAINVNEISEFDISDRVLKLRKYEENLSVGDAFYNQLKPYLED